MEAMKQVSMMEGGLSSRTPAEIMSTVVALLRVLEELVSSHADTAASIDYVHMSPTIMLGGLGAVTAAIGVVLTFGMVPRGWGTRS